MDMINVLDKLKDLNLSTQDSVRIAIAITPIIGKIQNDEEIKQILKTRLTKEDLDKIPEEDRDREVNKKSNEVLMSIILVALQKYDYSLYEVISIVCKCTVEQAKEQSISTTLNSFFKIATGKEMIDFFQ